MPLEPGQTLLHYRLVEKIGEGGMGVVWKAEDTRLRRHVALKFVPRERLDDPGAVERHLREARAASALNHPNICAIHDVGEQQGRPYIVMELLEGRPLSDLVAEGPLDVDRAVALALEIADALDAAHERGIVHRDIKTANVVVTERGSAKVLDFGLAKLAAGPGADSQEGTRTALDVTRPGSVVGTVSYMSPEQALGKELDRRTDVFSLGVVLYEMITGRRAFEGSTTAAVYDAILNRAPTAPVELNRAVPADLERIVNRCLEKDPGLRFQTAAELKADLERLRRGAAVSAGRPPHGRRTPLRPALLALGAVATLTLVAVGAWQMSVRTVAGPGADASPGADPEASRPAVSGLRVAVVPFVNAGGDPEQRYFSEGLTSEIVTDLSRYGELAVMTCRTGPCEGTSVDAREVGRELGARYVLQGRVQSTSDRIRVSVQLSDGRDGRSVWGETFQSDRSARDLFDLQDELTDEVVNNIAGSYGAIARAELPRARSKPPESLDSHDCVFRAYDYLQNHVAETHLAARECLERVVAAEPDYVDGLAWLAYLYVDQFHHRWNEPQGEYDSRERAIDTAERAVALDDGNQLAHAFLGLAAAFSGDSERGIAEMRRALELNPNNPVALHLLSNYLAYQGEFETAVPMARRAIELSPHPPEYADMPLFVDHFVHGRYEQALVHSRGGIVGNETDFREPMFLAATLGMLGRDEEAQPALSEMRELWALLCEKAGCTGLDIRDLRRELLERHAFSPEFTEKLIEGLARAGLQEAGRVH